MLSSAIQLPDSADSAMKTSLVSLIACRSAISASVAHFGWMNIRNAGPCSGFGAHIGGRENSGGRSMGQDRSLVDQRLAFWQ